MLQGKRIKKITVIRQKIKRLQNSPNFFLIGVFDSHRKGTPVIIIDLLSSYKALIFKDQSPLPPSPRGITRMTVIFFIRLPWVYAPVYYKIRINFCILISEYLTTMKLTHLMLFVLVCCTNFIPPCPGQPRKKIDSLNRLLLSFSADSNTIKIYGQLAWTYAGTREKLDTARMYADSIYLLAESLNDERGMILAQFYYGTVDRHKGNLVSSLEHFNKYVEYYKKKENSHLIATGLYQVGVIEKNLGNYEESLSTFYQVLAIHESSDYQYGIGFTSNAIGGLQRTVKNYENAIRSYRRSIQIFSDLKEDYDLAMSLENLGNVFSETGQYDSALQYYQRALDIDTRLGKKFGIASTLENMGNMYLEMGDTDKALNYHLQSLEIRKNLPQKVDVVVSLNRLGAIYKQLARYDLSENYLNQASDLSRELQAKPELLFTLQHLAELHELKGEFLQAVGYHKEYILLRDSILNEENLKQINDLETRYQTAKKDQEIQLLSKENEVKEAKVRQQSIIRNSLLGIITLMVALAFSLFFSFRQKLKAQKIISAKNEEIKISDYQRKLTNLELKALRSQMNPHFIFNCMNSINRMIMSGESEDASRYLNKFSRLIRLTLENSENSTVTLEDELTMLEAYIQLEAVRFKGKINYTITVDESIDKSSTSLPSMVLQPFIENAIWHGLMHKNEPGNIYIRIHEEDDILKCTIEDDGVGREMALQLRGKSEVRNKSMGLKITEERLKLFSKDKMIEWIQIVDLKDARNKAAGTRVNISIPLN